MPLTAIGFVLIFSVGALVALRKPFIGLLLYFFCFYMHPPGKYWGAYLPEIRWTFIVAIVTIIGVLFSKENKTEWLRPKQSKLLIAFAIFVIIQTPFAISFDWHKEYAILLIKLLIVYFLIITLVNSKSRLIALIVTNLMGAAYIGLNALQTHTGGRLESAGLPSIDDSNLIAIHMIAIVFLGGFLFLSLKNWKWKIGIGLLLALSGNLILMSASRGGVGALAITGALLIIFSPSDFRMRFMKWGAIALLVVSSLTIDMIINRMGSAISSEGEEVDKSAQSRMVIINAQIEMVKDSPIFGNGHRTTLLLSPAFIPEEYMTKTKVGQLRGSHNVTLSYLADHGIIGGGIMLLVIVLTILSSLKTSKNNTLDKDVRLFALGVSCALLGSFIASQFSNSKVLEVTFWLLALCIVVENLVSSTSDERKASINEKGGYV